MPKIRMIFGTIIEDGEGKRELACGEEFDLPKRIAQGLIDEGRAELATTEAPQA